MGEDYSGHPALRPLASLGVALRAFNIAPGNIVEPLSVQILPYPLRFNIFAIRELPASNSFGGGGGLLRASCPPPTRFARVALRAFKIAPGDFVELLTVQILPCKRSTQPNRQPCSSYHILFWWRGEDSNLRRWNQQIYSLPPLAAREPLLKTKPRILLEHYATVNRDITMRALYG